eukprot:CAMPEP_0184289516 /NCGR_PEP_ID=MMETSP1049-20130417/1955_1 /TAXON_ID=77928 /ORGANISM="Proteomonas sulcata, Strain CCMP704" /LENGTH=448 /DNA_ID=CAMNT_0026596365 /DNA_START=24 /DNA_END=1370 /DNA_ORIENTATION=-
MTLDGHEAKAAAGIKHYAHLNDEEMGTARALWISFLVLCILIIMLNLVQFMEARIAAKDDGGWNTKVIFDIAYDLFQVVVLAVVASQYFDASMTSETRSVELLRNFTAVPWAARDVSLSEKMGNFATAVRQLEDELSRTEAQNLLVFITMILMLVRIIKSTEVHPRTGLLTETLFHAMMDMWHFGLIFCLVFFFAASVSTWSFGASRHDFKDLRASMRTQFKILMGDLPEDFDENLRMILFVALSVVVQYILMLNFLLGLVLEAYDKVRQGIEGIEVENEVVYDLAITLRGFGVSLAQGWPRKSKLIHILRCKISSRNVSAEHLRLAGIPVCTARRIIEAYQTQAALRPKDELRSIYDVLLQTRGSKRLIPSAPTPPIPSAHEVPIPSAPQVPGASTPQPFGTLVAQQQYGHGAEPDAPAPQAFSPSTPQPIIVEHQHPVSSPGPFFA